MRILQPVRGTQDLLPEAARRHRHITETAREVAALYGFGEIATPIFEFTEVFARPIGETSDIVSKEMYSFVDRGGDEITLRPEYTAGLVRAVLSDGLLKNAPLKFFCHGPMFRYERPQKGRFRQFHQIDVELIGVAQPQADIEVIVLGSRILEALGVRHNTVLELNTLGDPESRAAYRDALVTYFSRRLSELSEDSRRRLERNPLRIFDSKEESDRRVSLEAPAFGDYLNAGSRDFFAQVCDGLDLLGIPYRLNPRLVRGLDYYIHTAFEFVTSDLGAQGTVIGGGRYDGLVEMMGGPATPGIGWAAGIERLAMLIPEPAGPPRPIALVPVGPAGERLALRLAEELRDVALPVDLGYSGNLARRMRRANRIGARAAVLIGDDEIARGVAGLRDLDSGAQSDVPLDELRSRLATLVG
ncbi:MAG: histidine--tRNA ligase [Alphaproteobacteria bacterium]|nr:histidine--tRNA ligase [Alphaproteobacteria bacterium]